MNTVLSHKDKYASYQLSIENRIICAVVCGAVGNSFSARYNRDFCLLIDQLGPGIWGHFADFTLCEALTAEAQDASKVMHLEAKKRGCVVSAFQMSSALLTSQINTIRKKNDLPTLENQRVFATKSEAIAFIEDYLLNTTTTEKNILNTL